MENDGNIMRCEVPGNVNVRLEDAEVQTPRADVLNFAQVAGVDDFLDLADGSLIDESMPDCESQIPLFGSVYQLFTLCRRAGHGFFDERVLSGLEAFPAHLEVEFRGRSYCNGINCRIIEHTIKFGGCFNLPIQLPDMR